MSGTARASQGGYCCHVINRGNGRAEVFHKGDDYRAFVRLIGEVCKRLPMRVLEWCLMPNLFTSSSGRTLPATWDADSGTRGLSR